jgi:hypothetical protein
VVKDVGGIYQGAKVTFVDILTASSGSSYLVKFDKLIRILSKSSVRLPT